MYTVSLESLCFWNLYRCKFQIETVFIPASLIGSRLSLVGSQLYLVYKIQDGSRLKRWGWLNIKTELESKGVVITIHFHVIMGCKTGVTNSSQPPKIQFGCTLFPGHLLAVSSFHGDIGGLKQN